MRRGGGDGHLVICRTHTYCSAWAAWLQGTQAVGRWWRTCPSPGHSAALPGLWKHQPWLEGEGSLRGRDGQRSQNSKLHAQQVWKAPLLFKAFFICAAATSVWCPVDQLGSHQSCFSGTHVDEDFFFFQTEKKKIPRFVMQKAGSSAFPVLRSFTAYPHAFWI